MFLGLFNIRGQIERRTLGKALGSCCALTAAVALACAGATSAGATTSSHPVQPGVPHPLGHKLVPAKSGARPADVGNTEIVNGYGYPNELCLDAENDSVSNPNVDGDRVQMYTCNGFVNQAWNVNTNPGSFGTITNNYGNHLCLSAEDDSNGNPSQNADPVHVDTCDGGSHQQWEPVLLSDGWYAFVNEYDDLVLDAEADFSGNPTQNGDKIQIFTWNGGVQQQWFY
jgi:hypothetical protein